MRTLFCAGLLGVCAVSHAASFSCARARSAQEKAICASADLSAADERMARAYRSALAQAPPAQRAAIREGQLTWIRSFPAACPDAEEMTECLARYEAARTSLLGRLLAHRGGVTFLWMSITLVAPGSGRSLASEGGRPVFGPGTLNASWPQALSGLPAWLAWNDGIEQAARGLASGGGSKPGAKWDPLWTADIDTDLTASLELVTGDLVTATIDRFWDGHGAHPNENSIELNWLLKRRRALQAEDLFRPGSGWDGALQSICDRDLHGKLDAVEGQSYEELMQPGQMQQALHAIVTRPENWRIDAAGIAIVWQKYAVACYACTPEPTVISWARLKPYLRPDLPFAIPSARAAADDSGSVRR